jgi:hypothetical protein
MQSTGRQLFWCPRCGTLRDELASSNHIPKLVERCRRFDELVGATVSGQSKHHWHTLGIAESINLPADRPA